MNSIVTSPTHRTHNGATVGLYGTQPAPVPVPPMLPVALPEAACSVNLFFEVAAGYGKAQATGRGSNAQEAVANLKATIEATRAALAPPAPVELSRGEHVAKLLSCGIGKAVLKGDFQRVERLAKASALVLSGAVEACAVEGAYTVQSRTQEGVVYDVNAAGCSCKDAQYRAPIGQTIFCCHSLAVLMEIRLAETAEAF